MDEAHIHLDSDQGYGWSIKGERFWVSSSSPGLEKVSFYGVYLYNLAQVRLFAYDSANKENKYRGYDEKVTSRVSQCTHQISLSSPQ